MNKFIIFALLIVFVLNQTEEEEEESGYTGKNYDKCIELNNFEPSATRCNSITLDEGYNCCYLTVKDDEGENGACLPLNESEAKELEDDAKEDDEVSNFSIICSLNTNNSNDSSDSSSSSYNYINKALIILLSLLF
jgi:hypothetical protein